MRLPSTRNQRFRAQKTEFSKYALQGGHFENRDSSHSCGRAKTEVFKYDDVMPRFKARSSAHTIRKRYVWTQIFLNTEKKNLRFQKYPATCGLSNTIHKRYVWTHIFLNTEEKISVFENTRLHVDEVSVQLCFKSF